MEGWETTAQTVWYAAIRSGGGAGGKAEPRPGLRERYATVEQPGRQPPQGLCGRLQWLEGADGHFQSNLQRLISASNRVNTGKNIRRLHIFVL